MSSPPQTFVIVGASLAGAKAAEALRSYGFDGRVVLMGEEPQRPYVRPPLSKAYLRGDADLDAVYVHPETFYAANDIELRTATTATELRPASSEVVCSDGEALHYDRLLLTTGARARRLPVPGAQLDGIYQLRTLADADRLRERLAKGEVLAVVGGSPSPAQSSQPVKSPTPATPCAASCAARLADPDIAVTDLAPPLEPTGQGRESS